MALPFEIIPPRDARWNSAIVDAAGWRLVACRLSARRLPHEGDAVMWLIPGRNGSDGDESPVQRQVMLGALERDLMQILWASGESSVREVSLRMNRPLAYTTVMTTLERLFKKGLLDRRKSGRAFFYTPRVSLQEWEQLRAGDLVANLLSSGGRSRDLLISCLVEAVGRQDDRLLEDLERKIRRKRKELARRSKS